MMLVIMNMYEIYDEMVVVEDSQNAASWACMVDTGGFPQFRRRKMFCLKNIKENDNDNVANLAQLLLSQLPGFPRGRS